MGVQTTFWFISIFEFEGLEQSVTYNDEGEYKNQQLHVVAHSMGGLVVTNSIRQCRDWAAMRFVNSVTTISSPFGEVSILLLNKGSSTLRSNACMG
ncbi:hypothetical protein OK016_15245 [Vibrio chagasii]|nr:hypothetical protein [Vibrio chagasii]